MAREPILPKLARSPVALATCVAGFAVPALIFSGGPAGAAPTEPGDLVQDLQPAEACSTCHEFPTPADLAMDGGSVDPWAWRGSMMGNSARDPVFWAGVALASQDHPEETIECVRCHAPRAFQHGQGEVTELAALTIEEREGVECDVCHRMVDDGETPPGNARLTLVDTPEGEPIPRFGPWTYDMLGPAPQHGWAQDTAYLPSGAMCGSCHDVTTPRERVDDRGVGMGVPFNEQRTYSEWLRSAYADPGSDDAATCRDCHMPAIDSAIVGCNLFAGPPHPDGGTRHVLVGANATTLAVLQNLYGSAGTGEVADARFEESIAWTQSFVRTSATLEVEFPDSVDASAGIGALPVTVTNETGHKLPSGYSEGRVMWLEVTARYDGEVVWSSGLWDGEADTIEDDEQVRRYEAIAERYSDGETFHLLLNDHWVLDNRIPPRDLQPHVDTDPVGTDRYPMTGDGAWPHWDETSYSFAGQTIADNTPDDEDDQLELSVRLLYLINTPEYLATLLEDNAINDAGMVVDDAFAAIGGAEPILLAEATATVPLTGLEGTSTGTEESGETSTDTGTELGESEESDEIGESSADAMGDDADGSGSGCSCSADEGSPGRDPSAPFAAGLMLLGLAALRRRS